MSEKLSHEEFVKKAIVSLRKEGYIGIHTVSIQDSMRHSRNILMEKTLWK